MEDLARVGAVGDELGACGLDVVDDEERALNRARRGGREALPMRMEHGEPGGVSCTTRQSPLAKSASSRHPRPS
jgi:hypothetical protein